MKEEFLFNVSYLKDLMYIAYSDAIEAYDALEHYEGDNKYIVALSYLNMANQGYLELMRAKHKYQLDCYEISPFFDAFERYKFQLKKVITSKDQNTSWLYCAHNSLKEKWKLANEFLEQSIKNQTI